MACIRLTQPVFLPDAIGIQPLQTLQKCNTGVRLLSVRELHDADCLNRGRALMAARPGGRIQRQHSRQFD
jgi:hypothetical protein